MMMTKILQGGQVLGYGATEPQLGDNCFVASGAHVIGDVIAGEDVSFWFNTVVRGDCNFIRIGDRTNIQDGTVIHVTHSTHPTKIGSDVTIGHGAVIHGCTIESNCLIGMGSIILDGAVIPEGSWVAAGALVPPNKQYPPNSMILGSPAKAVRSLRPHESAIIKESVNNYLTYKAGY
jgi:gamma-carbonic anhydrase